MLKDTLSLSLCVYTHTAHAYTHTHTYTYIHTYMHTHIYTYMYACMHTCIHIHPGWNVGLCLVCETRPLPVYPIVFRHPGLPVGGKYSVFHVIHRHVRSFLLVSLIWQPACASSLRRRGQVKKKNLSNILNLDYNT